MEPQCLDCCRKHLGMAHGYLSEAQTERYPTHFWKAIGQLCLAENHCRQSWPDLCLRIETERLKMMTDTSYWCDMDLLIDYADQMVEREAKKTNQKETSAKLNDLVQSSIQFIQENKQLPVLDNSVPSGVKNYLEYYYKKEILNEDGRPSGNGGSGFENNGGTGRGELEDAGTPQQISEAFDSGNTENEIAGPESENTQTKKG